MHIEIRLYYNKINIIATRIFSMANRRVNQLAGANIIEGRQRY